MRVSLKAAAISVAVVFATYTGYVVLSGLGFDPIGLDWNFATSGQLGDSFGPLSTLMASAAAYSAILAYLSQKEELARVKANSETETTRAANRDFENTFFNLLGLLRETVKEISVPDAYNQNPESGNDGLRRIYDFIGEEALPVEDGSDAISFRKYHTKFRDELAHYFRLIYHILKFVHESEIVSKKRYIGIFRATLSEGELGLIALNCMHGAGKRKLKPLVEKYALLHNISDWSAHHWRMLDGLKPAAFGDRDIKRAVENFQKFGHSEVDQED